MLMPQKLINLITLDFRQFKFARIKRGIFNELSMTDGQFYGLESFLSITRDLNFLPCYLSLSNITTDKLGNYFGLLL